MSKRKVDGDEGSSSDSDVSLIDVDFDFFDPNPNVDYHAFKRLLGQLFQRDADRFSLHDLTELILSQPTVGTTIKTDGLESDPYALLTVLNVHQHAQHPTPAPTQLGLVICERLVNMPVQTVPPMYRMLTDELKWAVADGEPYAFTHLLFISRAEEALANRAPSRRSKKSKKQKPRQPPEQQRPQDGIYSFHPEDTLIREHTMHSLSYSYSADSAPREADSFGLDVRGSLMLIESSRWQSLVERMAEVYV
ncbi:p21-C-terminal region-binding protein-domain-containing protein [Roridomyces roridus]|uniref:P21-C-terminal region-binding protein-domain-containing protein n=1 Tax=Roridomyces roridus TaxID=1738132 RepID=A0AAD7CC04_9AGAR|nr:p21-C-terminal region-binding protein-domain-containing protein [Roridomyces roridus]